MFMGSTIRVGLPRGELAARSQEVPAVTVGRRAGLLVIDDEELVIKAVSRILSPNFWRPATRSGGTAAGRAVRVTS
jgi:hypothetical protein